MKRQRRAQIVRAALRECAQIIESALGVDLGIHSELATNADENNLIEQTMRKVSDALYQRAEGS